MSLDLLKVFICIDFEFFRFCVLRNFGTGPGPGMKFRKDFCNFSQVFRCNFPRFKKGFHQAVIRNSLHFDSVFNRLTTLLHQSIFSLGQGYGKNTHV